MEHSHDLRDRFEGFRRNVEEVVKGFNQSRPNVLAWVCKEVIVWAEDNLLFLGSPFSKPSGHNVLWSRPFLGMSTFKTIGSVEQRWMGVHRGRQGLVFGGDPGVLRERLEDGL